MVASFVFGSVVPACRERYRCSVCSEADAKQLGLLALYLADLGYHKQLKSVLSKYRIEE
jgi:hypothetical protein